MEIINLNKKNLSDIINKTIKVLTAGGLVVYPSDTVYGLLVNATDLDAVKKLVDFKNRLPGKAISVFADDFPMVERLTFLNSQQDKTIKELLPGPYTIVLRSKNQIVRLLESEKNNLGVRIPNYLAITELVKKFGKPITATSANLGNRPPNYSIHALLNSLPENKKAKIDLIVDAGTLPRNKPSTVVDLTEPDIKILRKGDLDLIKTENYKSGSPDQTKKIAAEILRKTVIKNKPVVFIIEGELGVGKTIFVKGLGESLGIENIISPTFVIYYEYKNFYHFDLYQIKDKEEYRYLGIEKFLKPGNILCFEWGEKAGDILGLLKDKSKIINVKMKYINDKEREITVKY